MRQNKFLLVSLIVLFILIVIFILWIVLWQSTTDVDKGVQVDQRYVNDSLFCLQDSDCKPNNCCCSNGSLNFYHAPDCNSDTIVCPLMVCGYTTMGYSCMKNQCRRVECYKDSDCPMPTIECLGAYSYCREGVCYEDCKTY